jgi:hypothetical protein
MNEKIEILILVPFEEVGIIFEVTGWIPKSWFKTFFGAGNVVSCDLIDINGKEFGSVSLNVVDDRDWLSKLKKKSKVFR